MWLMSTECWGREKPVLVWEITCATALWLPSPRHRAGPAGRSKDLQQLKQVAKVQPKLQSCSSRVNLS